MPRRLALLPVLAVLAAALGACAADAGSPSVQPASGGPWEAVLPAPVVATLLAGDTAPEWIAGRRDASLSPRGAEPVLATAEWPQPGLTTLDDPDYVRVGRSPWSFIVYGTDAHRHSPHHYSVRRYHSPDYRSSRR